VTGSPTILARRAYVPGGVEVLPDPSSPPSRFTVRFATRRARCSSVDWPGSDHSPVAAPCPAKPNDQEPVVARTEHETLRVMPSTGEGGTERVILGASVFDAPRAPFGHAHAGRETIAKREFAAPSGGPGGGLRAPALIAIGEERFLLLWVEGGTEGHVLRGQPVTGWVDAQGPALELSPREMSVIGRPSAAVAPDGEGLVAFLASTNGEFDVLATPVRCRVERIDRDALLP
jgi:hypothetical protein